MMWGREQEDYNKIISDVRGLLKKPDPGVPMGITSFFLEIQKRIYFEDRRKAVNLIKSKLLNGDISENEAIKQLKELP